MLPNRSVRNPLFDDPELSIWYELPIRSVLETGPIEARAIAHNLMCDHRVTLERARAFHDFVRSRVPVTSGPPLSSQLLEVALREYHEEQVRGVGRSSWPRVPGFLRPCNAFNAVYGHPDVAEPLPGNLELGRAINLSRLARVVAQGRREGISEFQTVFAGGRPDEMEGSPFEDTWNRHLNQRLFAPGERRSDLIVALFDALNQYSGNHPHNPSWAGRWLLMSDYLIEGRPERWCACVGVPVYLHDWIIVVKYTVAETGTLLRPTQFDAGVAPYHFPSPPGMRVCEGGLAMHLERECRELVAEFVHAQIPLRFEHWLGANKLCAQVTENNNNMLVKSRHDHRERLSRRFGNPIADWISIGA